MTAPHFTPVFDDPRVDEAFDAFNGSPTADSFRGVQFLPSLKLQAARVTERANLVAERNNLIPAARGAQDQKIAQHDRETEALRDSQVARLSEGADRLVAHMIQAQAPTFPPRDAADATRINGVLADAPHYSPTVLERIGRDAMARGDLPLVSRLHDFIESKIEYSKIHQTRGLTSLLVDMRFGLRDERVVASDAAKQWAQQAKRDVLAALQLVHDPRPDALKIYATSGALPALYPRSIAK